MVVQFAILGIASHATSNLKTILRSSTFAKITSKKSKTRRIRRTKKMKTRCSYKWKKKVY